MTKSKSEQTPESSPESTSEPTPESTSEPTPESSPEPTPESSLESTPLSTPPLITQLSPQSHLQACVVGCGQCGSRIAAFFDKTPSFLKYRSYELYPVRCAAIDTDPGIPTSLTMPPWNWQEPQDIHTGIPLAVKDKVIERIFKTKRDIKALQKVERDKGLKGQAGHFPYMGTLAAEEHLRLEATYGEELQRKLIDRRFTRGFLIVANSLTGGTGTGFAPVVPRFLASWWQEVRLSFNLCIIPQMRDIDARSIFPGNIIYGLYNLSQSKNIDAVILADNDVMSAYYNCKGNPEYNNLLHEILANFILAPIHKYDCQNFGCTMDHADMRRIILPNRGFGVSELCALSYAQKKPPRPFCMKLKSKINRANYIKKWLEHLVDSAVSKTTVGPTKTDSEGRLIGIKGALVILSGPPYFFDKVLEGVEGYYSYMEDYIKYKVSPNFQLGFLQFTGMKHVSISLILSGITSDKLETIYQQVVPTEEQVKAGSLMERIRWLKPKVAEDIMIKEIRENLSKEITQNP